MLPLPPTGGPPPLTKHVERAIGSRDLPLTNEQLETKFMNQAKLVIGEPQSRALATTIGGLAGMGAGAYLTVSVVVLEARFGRYVHDIDDVLGWRAAPILVGGLAVARPRACPECAAEDSLASTGEKLFADLACNTCHMDESQGRGPSLNDIYGKPVQLQSGSTVIADDAYIRESIVNPQAQIVAGYQPIMPTFQGLVSEEQLLQLIAYVRSLSQQPPAPAGTTAPTMPQASDRPVIEKK